MRARFWDRVLRVSVCILIASVIVAIISNQSRTSTGNSVQATPDPTIAPVSTLTRTQWAAQNSRDGYTRVNDHPDLHYGDKIIWTCTIAKFLGDNPSTIGNTDIGCMVHVGEFNDQEIILNAPPAVDTSQMDTGDTVVVYGTVDSPMQGKTVLGADSTWTQIDATYIDDYRLMHRQP